MRNESFFVSQIRKARNREKRQRREEFKKKINKIMGSRKNFDKVWNNAKSKREDKSDR